MGKGKGSGKKGGSHGGFSHTTVHTTYHAPVVHHAPAVVIRPVVVHQPYVVRYRYNLYGCQPMPLYPYIPYCHPMTIVYVNRPWPYNPMYRVVEGKPLGNPCVATKKQADWRWCNKCQSLTYSALGAGVCAMGGGHTFDGSGKYYLNLEASNDCG